MFDAIGRRIRAWGDRHFIGLTMSTLVFLMLVFYFAPKIFITIPAGHGGALWLRFFGGTVLDFNYGEGTKIIFPWDRIYIYDVRVQQKTARFDVLTSEGLPITVEVTLRFRLKPDSLAAITAFAGPDYIATLAMPTLGALTQLEAAQHTVEEIYSTQRNLIETRIFNAMGQVIENLIPNHLHQGSEIEVLAIWFREIRLPPPLQNAIESKLGQRQQVEQYRFILQREELERERKNIEAMGIKQFQDTVSSGITDSYLRWKGIDATLKLADSPNTKTVIIGNGKDGLPLILGPLESPGSQTKSEAPASPSESSGAAAPSPSLMRAPSSSIGGTTANQPSSAVGSGVSTPVTAPPLTAPPGVSLPAAPPQAR